MSLRVYVHGLEPRDQLAVRHAANVRECLVDALGANALTDDRRKADMILLVPSFHPMFHWYGRHLLADPVVKDHLSRCFVLESSDGPADYLRGCYVSMPAHRYDAARHRPIGFLYAGDRSGGPGVQTSRPTRLFSFRGAESHPLRRQLCQALEGHQEGIVTLTGRWLNYSASEYAEFWHELDTSKFALCPRGIGTSSIRVQETMQAGRAPVIIADDWVPPMGPDWDSFSVRVREDAIAEIPSLLQHREADAADMGKLARAEWEKFYDPQGAFGRWLVEMLEEVDGCSAGWSASAEIERWSSPGFRWSHGFDPLHRAINVATRTRRRLLTRASTR